MNNASALTKHYLHLMTHLNYGRKEKYLPQRTWTMGEKIKTSENIKILKICSSEMTALSQLVQNIFVILFLFNLTSLDCINFETSLCAVGMKGWWYILIGALDRVVYERIRAVVRFSFFFFFYWTFSFKFWLVHWTVVYERIRAVVRWVD